MWYEAYKKAEKTLNLFLTIVCFGLLVYLALNGPVEIPVTTPVVVEKEVIKEVPVDVDKSITIDTAEIVRYLNPRIDVDVAVAIGKAVDKYSLKYKLPRNLILGIINKESTFNPMAKSSVAYGLMQIYPKFHKEKLEKRGITDLKDIYHIDTNIDIGCEIFREYYDRSDGDIDETFHMYLSKNATIKHRDYYMKVVFDTWVKIDFYEYQKGIKNEVE